MAVTDLQSREQRPPKAVVDYLVPALLGVLVAILTAAVGLWGDARVAEAEAAARANDTTLRLEMLTEIQRDRDRAITARRDIVEIQRLLAEVAADIRWLRQSAGEQ